MEKKLSRKSKDALFSTVPTHIVTLMRVSTLATTSTARAAGVLWRQDPTCPLNPKSYLATYICVSRFLGGLSMLSETMRCLALPQRQVAASKLHGNIVQRRILSAELARVT